MARSLRDSKLDSREARARLKARGKPYWRLIEPGLHLGYRRLASRPGTWCIRRYVGGQTYSVETLKGVVADDNAPADGATVLSFSEAQREVHKYKPKVAGSLTVAGAVEAYLAYLEADRGKIATDARHCAAAFIYPTLGDVEVAALTAEVLRRWHTNLAKTPARVRSKPGKQQHRAHDGSAEALRRRRSSANRILATLRAALNHAFREGKVGSDSAWRKVRPFMGVNAARVRYITVAEAKRLINAATTDFRRLVEAALQTGCRFGELIRLEVRDFSADSGTIHVRTSKSGKSRHVTLTMEGAVFFAQLCAGRRGAAIMLVKANGAPWRKAHQQVPMTTACTHAGIDPPISFHALRHTWASLAVMNGVPVLVVAKNLGHADTRMVEMHYGHMSPSFAADAIRAGAPRFGTEPDQKIVPLPGRR
jgi:integrase